MMLNEVPMDENDIETVDLVMKLINAIDDFQVARSGPAKQEEDAFNTLLALRNDISERHYV